MDKTNLVKICVDMIKNPAQVEHFSKGKDPDTRVREAFFELMGTDKPNEKDIRNAGVQFYQILEDIITETYLTGVNEDQFFMRFAEVRNLALGDSQEFFIKDDAEIIVSEHAGNNWNVDRQKLEGGTPFTVKVKSYSAAIYGDFFLFLTNRLSFGELVAKVGEGIQTKIYQEVAASFADGTAKLPAAFKKSGVYDEEKLMELVDLVEAGSGSAIVVGTRKALSKIGEIEYYTEGMKAELNRTGRVGQYKGMEIAQLPAVFKPNSFDFAYEDDQILVLPGNDDKFIKLVFEGSDWVRETTNNTDNIDMSYNFSFLTKFGCTTVMSSLFGQYKLLP